MREDLIASLKIMGMGMLGLFVICGFIACLILLIKRLITAGDKTGE